MDHDRPWMPTSAGFAEAPSDDNRSEVASIGPSTGAGGSTVAEQQQTYNITTRRGFYVWVGGWGSAATVVKHYINPTVPADAAAYALFDFLLPRR